MFKTFFVLNFFDLKLILFDGKAHHTLKPFTWTRPVADMRLGAFTIAEKWAHHTKLPFHFLTSSYLQSKYPISIAETYLYVSGNVLPFSELVDVVLNLNSQEVLRSKNGNLIAFKCNQLLTEAQFEAVLQNYQSITTPLEIIQLSYPEYFIKHNAQEIYNDFQSLMANVTSQNLSQTNTVLGNQIWVAEGVQAECCTFNTQTGPIIIGENAQIMEGSHLRGPVAIGENAVVKMGSKIYGGTTIGPYCTVGSEVKNSIFWGYSNKGHDGYIGDSMIGAWCNLGAGTSNSNMKNNLKSVKLWDYSEKKYRDTQFPFCGLMMGDFSMSAIHTAFNTGTVVGVGANIINPDFSLKFIPDFSWGNSEYVLEKALSTLEILWNRKKIELDSVNKLIFSHIFNHTKEFRK